MAAQDLEMSVEDAKAEFLRLLTDGQTVGVHVGGQKTSKLFQGFGDVKLPTGGIVYPVFHVEPKPKPSKG